MDEAGYEIDTIIACGGGTKNGVFLQEHAMTGCMILLPEESESVLLGSAMLSSVAADFYSDTPDAMNAMSCISKSAMQQTEKIKRFYDAKYKVFHKMYEDDVAYKRLMGEF